MSTAKTAQEASLSLRAQSCHIHLGLTASSVRSPTRSYGRPTLRELDTVLKRRSKASYRHVHELFTSRASNTHEGSYPSTRLDHPE